MKLFCVLLMNSLAGILWNPGFGGLSSLFRSFDEDLKRFQKLDFFQNDLFTPMKPISFQMMPMKIPSLLAFRRPKKDCKVQEKIKSQVNELKKSFDKKSFENSMNLHNQKIKSKMVQQEKAHHSFLGLPSLIDKLFSQDLSLNRILKSFEQKDNDPFSKILRRVEEFANPSKKQQKKEAAHKNLQDYKANQHVSKTILEELDGAFEHQGNVDVEPEITKIQQKLEKVEKQHHDSHREDEDPLFHEKSFEDISKDIENFNSILKNKQFDSLKEIHEKQSALQKTHEAATLNLREVNDLHREVQSEIQKRNELS